MPKTLSESVLLERHDRAGPIRVVAVAEGYVMARRPYGFPFVVAIDNWNKIGPDVSMTSMGTII